MIRCNFCIDKLVKKSVEGNQRDLTLIDKILEGDESCFKELVKVHKHFAFTIAYRILTNKEDAEEATQDAFLKAYFALKKFNRTSKFTTWLYKIVFNTSISYKRKQRNNVDSLEHTIQNKQVAIESKDPLEKQDKKKYLEMALTRMLPADATVLTLFYLKEFSLAEVSEITGMKLNAIKVRLFRARIRLADELQKLLKKETGILLD